MARADNDQLKAAAEAAHDPTLLPAKMPRFDLLVAGDDGAVWVRLFEVLPGATREFVVIGPTGGAIARITIPSELTIHQIGPDFVLGVRHDADGLETVVEYRLVAG